jgi:hypothetical protein
MPLKEIHHPLWLLDEAIRYHQDRVDFLPLTDFDLVRRARVRRVRDRVPAANGRRPETREVGQLIIECPPALARALKVDPGERDWVLLVQVARDAIDDIVRRAESNIILP